jgi:hypothetical protein
MQSYKCIHNIILWNSIKISTAEEKFRHSLIYFNQLFDIRTIHNFFLGTLINHIFFSL